MILFVSGASATVRKFRACGELIVPGAGNAPDGLKLARRQMFSDYSSKAGKAAQAGGRAHRWTSDDARWWGRLGGQCSRGVRRKAR